MGASVFLMVSRSEPLWKVLGGRTAAVKVGFLRTKLKYRPGWAMEMVEQPRILDDLLDHAALQRQIATPVCPDESVTSAEKARKATRLRSCGWINIKPGRVGGVHRAGADLKLRPCLTV
jgi:L-alanine-DL-glutamate epimerase-like enolase superfamily enzyme